MSNKTKICSFVENILKKEPAEAKKVIRSEIASKALNKIIEEKETVALETFKKKL